MSVYAELDLIDPTRIAVATMYKHKDVIAKIPGARYSNKDQLWKMPRGWTGCLALRTEFGQELELGPNLVEWATNERLTRIGPCLSLRTALEADGSPDLYPYQRAGVAFMAAAQRALLADEMGTGKTRQTLMAMMQVYMQGDNPFPALVVCPNSVKVSWKREAELVWPDLEVVIVRGSAAQRRKQLETPAHVYVMNWESVRGHSRLAPYGSISLVKCVECGGLDERITHVKCQTHERELNQMKFNTVIADEIHRSKDPKAQQTRALWAATGSAKFRFALSGTPIANAPDDLWTVLHWLSPEEWPSRTKYVDRMCEVSFNAFGAATVIGVKHAMQEEFFGGLDPRMRRMPKDLVLQFLPPVIPEVRVVEMPAKQKKAYEQMRDLMIAELDDGDLLVTTSPLVRATRLIQFASSFAQLETTFNPSTQKDESRVRLADPSGKLDAFMGDLDDFGGDSVVVFAVSRQLIEMLSARMDKAKIPHGLITGSQTQEERQMHMDAFQAGHTKYILCTIAAGGTGITLTAARIGVFLQRSWSMIDNNQAEARLHRIGSEIHDSITVIDYITENTIEETVIQAVQGKGQRLEAILRDKELLARAIKNEVPDDDS